jgi:hypothetical protein
MCQKTNTTKRFFVILNHPSPLRRPLVLGVVKPNPFTTSLYETTRNTLFLTDKDVKDLGYQPPTVHQAYMLPIEIPRDWFLH